jgi:hypothetical protein
VTGVRAGFDRIENGTSEQQVEELLGGLRGSPGKDKESTWLPAPKGHFSLYLRAYWAEKAILDGTWKPPVVKKVG